jgi:3-hydroxyisobutyrate dehydrogenase-like beta-hydroxyacid dehydrogenase
VARRRNCEPDENLFLIKESAVANLGFIGLGAMGGSVAARLLDSAHHVTGYNRTRAKAQWLVDRGMKWANSPRDVATAADVIFTMVTNAEALTSVAEGDSGLLAGLSSGKYCVDMSTVGPDISRRLASNVRERGADMIDAPVSGSVLTVQQGKLSIMVGGRQETFERLKPILQDIGPKVTYVGANGLALALKIALNLQLAVQMLAFTEGVLLAEKSGISRDTAVDVMLHSAVASPMLQYRGPFVLKQPEQAWFDVNMMQKDVLLAMELARKHNVPVPTTAVSNEFLTAARGMGWEKSDFAIIFEVLAQMAGHGG